MSAHTPIVKDAFDMDCFYSECEHVDGIGCPPPKPVVTCEACYEAEEPDVDGLISLPEWPCIHTTRRGVDQEIIAHMLAGYAAERSRHDGNR